MLKAHQACIDLEKNVLRIQGREVHFLSEHELPDKARIMDSGGEGPSAAVSSSSAGPSRPAPPTSFPGSGNTLGRPPPPAGAGSRAPPVSRRPPAAQVTNQFPESSITTLMDLGATREVAISTLKAAGGNVLGFPIPPTLIIPQQAIWMLLLRCFSRGCTGTLKACIIPISLKTTQDTRDRVEQN